MSVVQAPNPLVDEFADLIASGADSAELLAFRPSEATIRRANELLEILDSNELTDDEEHELNMFQQAETLLRLIKARVRRMTTP